LFAVKQRLVEINSAFDHAFVKFKWNG
jgi:hypothetical protein